ncbi:hypothetical protein BH09SUM1_BH09SUM1_04770 [soil metagenome]
MRNKVITFTAAALILGAGFTYYSAQAAESDAAPQITKGKGTGITKGLTNVAVATRGNTRSLYTNVSLGTGDNQYDFVSATEMDLTSCFITAYTSSGASTYQGNVYIYWASSGQPTYPLNAVTVGTGTKQLLFDPPLALRVGDHLTVSGGLVPTGQTAYYEVSLVGLVPGAQATGLAIR